MSGGGRAEHNAAAPPEAIAAAGPDRPCLVAGGGLGLTWARYLTADGKPIHEEGLTPDLVIEEPNVEFDDLAPALLAEWAEHTPERAAEVCGIDAGDIRAIAAVIGANLGALASHTWRAAGAGNLGGWQTARCLWLLNVLTGSVAEIPPWLASHMDVNGIDLTGVTDPDLAVELEVAAADNLKRVRRPAPDTDWLVEPDLDRMTRFMETKTVWHPIGV